MRVKIIRILLRLVSRIAQRLPLRFAFKFGAILGALSYFFLPKRRRIIMTNLKFAYDDKKTKAECKDIMWRMYQNFGKGVIEFLRLPLLTSKNIDQYIKVEGMENLKNAVAQGRGVFVLSAHFGNGDMLAAFLILKGFSLNLITKYLKNYALNEFWMETRSKVGINLLYREGTLKQIMRHLRKNELMGFVLDQNVREDSGVFVDFFGKPAATLDSLAVISQRLKTPVLPSFVVRVKEGVHRVVFEKHLEFEEKGTLQESIVYNTQRYSDVLERYIRQYPDHWIWMHRRWKTRPEGQPKVY